MAAAFLYSRFICHVFLAFIMVPPILSRLPSKSETARGVQRDHESPPLTSVKPPMITFCAVLFRQPDSSRLPGSSCLNEEPRAQRTESLFHNQLTTIAYFWCQWVALSILGVWLTPARQKKKKKTQTAELSCATVSCRRWGCVGGVVLLRLSHWWHYTVILPFLSNLKITSEPAESYCKNLLWEPKITKDVNTRLLRFFSSSSSLFVPKATRVQPGEFKMLLPK